MEETSANWEKMEAFLPEEAEGANMVYIRWAADGDKRFDRNSGKQ